MLYSDDFVDKPLLSKIAQGDEEAFSQIFIKYAPALQSRLIRLIPSQFAQEDIIQETFIRVWLHRDQLPEIENWTAWLLRICYNRAFTFLRNQGRQQNIINLLPDNNRAGNQTQEMMEFHILKGLIAKAIELLPPQQKKVYKLNREYRMLIPEISQKLGISNQTVKNTLGLALKSIRSYLESYGYLGCLMGLFLFIYFF